MERRERFGPDCEGKKSRNRSLEQLERANLELIRVGLPCWSLSLPLSHRHGLNALMKGSRNVVGIARTVVGTASPGRGHWRKAGPLW